MWRDEEKIHTGEGEREREENPITRRGKRGITVERKEVMERKRERRKGGESHSRGRERGRNGNRIGFRRGRGSELWREEIMEGR